MIARLRAYLLGWREFRTDTTTDAEALYGEQDGRLTEAYDRGREHAHRVTLRRWDGAA